MVGAAERETAGPGPERGRRIAVARTCVAIAVLGVLAAVVPTRPVDGQQRLDATATTVPSDDAPRSIDGPPGDGDEPTAGEPTTTTTAPAQAVDSVGLLPVPIAAVAEADAPAGIVQPFRRALDGVTTTTAPSGPTLLYSGPIPPIPGPTSAPTSTAGSGPTQPPPTAPPTTAAPAPPTTAPPTTVLPTTTTTMPPVRWERAAVLPAPAADPADPTMLATYDCSTPASAPLIDWSRAFVVFDGQSNTVVPDAWSSYPGVLMREGLSGVPYVNAAIPGTTQLERNERAWWMVDPWANPATRPYEQQHADRPIAVLFNEGGATDLLRGATADQIIERTRAYVAGRRAAGYDLIVQAPTLPADGYYTQDQERERRRFHDRLCREYKSLGIDGLVDPTVLPALVGNRPPHWTDDGLHLTESGARLVAEHYRRTLGR